MHEKQKLCNMIKKKYNSNVIITLEYKFHNGPPEQRIHLDFANKINEKLFVFHSNTT